MEAVNSKLNGMKISNNPPSFEKTCQSEDGKPSVTRRIDTQNMNIEETQQQCTSKKECHTTFSSPSTNTVLITANVGSVFEDPSRLMPIWLDQFDKFLLQTPPGFVALHCQEVGGKDSSGQHCFVKQFAESVKEIGEKLGYTKMMAFFDEDCDCEERYTALGCVYLVHSTATNIEMYNFQTKSFVPIEKSIIKYGCIDNVELVEKRKFPLEYFPTNRWSRKGYLRTRWRIKSLVDESEGFTSASSTECKKEKEISTNSSNENNFSHPLSGPPCTTFDLVNIHLFHDADNIKSFKTFPSVFACCRQKALEYTLRELSDEKPTSETNDSTVPFFIFGDFNFRLNAKKVVSTLVLNNESPKEETKPSSSPHKSDTNYSVHDVGDDVILFKNKLSENTILSVGKKEFKLRSSKFDIFGEHWKLLKECDFETSSLYQSVVEFPLTFPPSYPFEENLDLHPIGDIGKLYMKTRCPAWCDRILVSLIAKKNLFSLNGVRRDECCDELESRSRLEDNNGEGVEYNVMGRDVCMGDHKPVYLKFRLQHGADNISEALVNLSSIDHDGSYLPRSQNEHPEEFPRIESPTYIDLLKNTDLNQSSPVQASMERTTNISEGFAKPSKTGSTSSSSPSSATTNVSHLNTTYTFKETTV